MSNRSLAASAPFICTLAVRPRIATPLVSLATETASFPLVALMTTVSAWPSPVPLPGGLPEVEIDLGHTGAR